MKINYLLMGILWHTLGFSKAENDNSQLDNNIEAYTTICTNCPEIVAAKKIKEYKFQSYSLKANEKPLSFAWLKLTIDSNMSNKEIANIIFNNPIASVQVFQIVNDSLLLVQKAGNRTSPYQLHFRYAKNWVQLVLKKGVFNEYYVLLKHSQLNLAYGFASIHYGHQLPETFYEKQFQIREPNRWFYIFLLGFSFMMCMFCLFKSFINNWDFANLFCSITFLCCYLNVLFWSEIVDEPFIKQNIRLALFLNQLIPAFILLLYREFFKVKVNSPVLYRFITFSFFVLFICNLLTLFENQFRTLGEIIFEYALLFTLLILPIAYLQFWKNPLFRFAVFSSWVTAFFFLLYMGISSFGLSVPLPIWFIPGNLMFIALFIDGLLFLIALNLRDRKNTLEKLELEKNIISYQLNALRSQMNPHFMFNALNSIKSFILDNEIEKSNYYLTKFSKLIRQVLENSRCDKISLKNELETVSLYLELEKTRIGDKFNYEINIADDIETEFIELPPMLLQPYIENAIWHGLVHKEQKGLVKIEIKQNKTNCLIIIEDNGIGRIQSNVIKLNSNINHNSMGLKINNERIEKINTMHKKDIKITIEDLYNLNKIALGTKVIIEIEN